MNTPFFFAYGTLRRLPASELHPLLARRASFAGNGTVQAQLFNLGTYTGMILSDDPLDRVLGEVFRFDPAQLDAALRELDEYEGQEYRRQMVSVRLPDSSTVEAWAYVVNRETQGCERIASGDYLAFRTASVNSGTT